MKHNQQFIVSGFLAASPLLILGGCQDMFKQGLFNKDIRRIAVFYATNPWVNFDQATFPKPEGLKFSFYLIDGKTQKGVFAAGECVVQLFARQDPADESSPMIPAREWRFPMSEVPRGSYETPLGSGYGLRLDWRPLDLEGQEIEVKVQLEQPNGSIVQSPVKKLEVIRAPRPKSAPSPNPRASPDQTEPSRKFR